MTTKPLSYGERKMKSYAADNPSPTTKLSPADEADRIRWNWEEIKKARINALKNRNAPGVKMLDQELADGRGKDFPADASFGEDPDFVPDEDSDFVPDKRVPRAAPRKPASQGVVRASEPSMALIEQEAAERGWENANKEFTAKGGVLKPGQTQAQAVTEATGLRNPADTREGAQAQHAADTGELIYGDSVAYNIAKPAAAIAGFTGRIPILKAGPSGATQAEMLVRFAAIGYNINAALDKGMDPDQAANLFVRELLKGAAVDAGFNFGAPLVGTIISKIPGLNRIADKISAELAKRLGGQAPRNLRDQKLDDLAALTENPARQQAVRELGARTKEVVPTPGQVTGEAGTVESAVRKATPSPFQRQEKELAEGAERMRTDLVSPGSQPQQNKLGEQIDRVVDETVKKTKQRLRPVFEEADRLNIIADFNKVGEIAEKALQKDAGVVGKGKLTEAERNHLQQIIADMRYQPYTGAEAALDFVSIQKSMMRKLNPDGKPSPYFSTIVGDLTRAANDAFEEGARRMGKHEIVNKLRAAREDYRIMNERAYAGAMKQVGIKGDHAPEDVGAYLWQNGKVTRIEELDELLGLAKREGVASPAALDKLRRNVTRGFLAEAVRDVESAANFTKSLSDPKRKATWEALTSGPTGRALRDGMAVLEQAAQIASHNSITLAGGQIIPLARAAGGGMGISYVTGTVRPGMMLTGLSLTGLTKAMATAYTQGNKGLINSIASILRANSVGTAAAAKAMQAALPQLEKWAAANGEEDMFVGDEQSDQQSGQQSGPK